MVKATAKATLFGTASPEEAGDEKLHDLYWNRAQLKQQFAEKEEENQRLRKIIEEQEGSVARVEQKLEHLENLLLDPDWVHNAVVHYQLLGLNARCCRKLATFAEQLKQQREERRRKQVVVDWNESRKADLAVVEQALLAHRAELHDLENNVTAEQLRMESMNGLSKLLRGRQSSAVIDELEAQLAVARERDAELLGEVETIRKREPPPAPGLDIKSKRSINFMILAFAQDILLRFEDTNFAAMVREAGEKSAGAIRYGSPADCGKLLRQVTAETRRVEEIADTPDALKARAARIAEHADFEAEDDAVPVPGTVAAIFAFDATGGVRTTDVNILGQDYWQLTRVVSR
jgi:hypothetical protein